MIHLKKKIVAQHLGTGPKIRLAFLHSDPNVPHGQLWDSGATLQHHLLPSEFRVMEEQEVGTGWKKTKRRREFFFFFPIFPGSSGEMIEWMEPYDALAATLCEDPAVCALVKSYYSWVELRDDLLAVRPLPFNVLWAGNWLFEAVGTYEMGEPRDQRGPFEESVKLMSDLKRRGVCLFPPLDYVLTFARKVRYLTTLSTVSKLPPEVMVPPTLKVDLENRRWKQEALQWLELYNVNRLMLKRELSGRGNHVKSIEKKADFPFIHQGLEWMLQPYNSAFDKHFEMRM
jgi:hypothetical protein